MWRWISKCENRRKKPKQSFGVIQVYPVTGHPVRLPPRAYGYTGSARETPHQTHVNINVGRTNHLYLKIQLLFQIYNHIWRCSSEWWVIYSKPQVRVILIAHYLDLTRANRNQVVEKVPCLWKIARLQKKYFLWKSPDDGKCTFLWKSFFWSSVCCRHLFMSSQNINIRWSSASQKFRRYTSLHTLYCKQGSFVINKRRTSSSIWLSASVLIWDRERALPPEILSPRPSCTHVQIVRLALHLVLQFINTNKTVNACHAMSI